jgi:hypothetical protein
LLPAQDVAWLELGSGAQTDLQFPPQGKLDSVSESVDTARLR